MGCFTPWVFLDNTGQTWALGMNAAGQLTFTLISNPPANNAAASVPLKDTVTGATVSLAVVFTTFPTLTPTSSSGPTIGSYIPLTRPGVGTYWLQVANGALVLNQHDGAATPDPVVGQLYNYASVNPPVVPPNLPNAGLPSGFPGGYVPVYSQPAGLGTQSLPTQAEGSQSMITGVPFEIGMGLNTAGCGHFFNSYQTQQTTIACQTYVLVQCPLCGFVQQTFPLAIAYDMFHEHLSS